MEDRIDLARLKELYLPPQHEFMQVDVPEMQFLMIDGEGDPQAAAFARSLRWLYTVIHPIKQIAKERMGRKFVEAPLEGLWWADDMNDLICGNRDKLKWRMMIVTADWVTGKMFDSARAAAAERLGDVPESLRLEWFSEGRSVQMMHVGDYPEAARSIADRLHKEYLPQHGLTAHGHHHEIYLNDPKRVAPEKRKTVVRQPVR